MWNRSAILDVVPVTKGHSDMMAGTYLGDGHGMQFKKRKCSDGILAWLRSVVPAAEADDNILLVC